VRFMPCTRRRGVRISWFGLKSKVDDLSVVRVSRIGPKNWQLWFGDSGLKITATVSWFGPQNHVGHGLSVVSQNRREDEDSMSTHRDLAGCFAWKQVWLVCPSLASTLVETRREWCTWHHRGGCIELKLKMDGPMRRVASDPSTLTLSFFMY
jgi:hypothetical protein